MPFPFVPASSGPQSSLPSPALQPASVPAINAPADVNPLASNPALPDGREALRKKLRDRRDLQTLARALHTAVDHLGEASTPEAITAYLRTTHMTLEPDAANAPPRSVSLESWVRITSAYFPKTCKDLQLLADAVHDNAQNHPLGNFTGALSWPVPLSAEHQRTVHNVVEHNSASLPGLPLTNGRTGVLEYLIDAVALSPQAVQDPAAALEKLLDSPRAAALGAAMQAAVGGIATNSSVNDYVLAAIHLSLDPEAFDTPSHRNTVAGISLDAELYRDASPAAVIDTLAQRLKSTGRVSAAHAEMAARLVLMRRAPQFLVKDLPPSVRTHTQAWANLCIAVAAIEAQTPGRTVNMNFAEIMCANAPEHAESEAVKKAALIEWAVANDEICRFPDEVYTSEVLDTLRRSFNKQHEALKEAAGLLDIPLPNRSQMAEELIKQTFGANAPLDEKIFRIDYHKMKIIGPRYSELHSMREITMQGLKVDSAYWELNSPRNDINLAAFADFTQSSQFNLPATFENRFTEATSQCKKIHHYAWMNAITGLSTADRAILNDAKLSFYKENTYRISTLPLVPNALFHTSPTLLMQAEYKGEKHFYEFDTTTATIKKVPLTHIKPDEYISDEVTKIEKIQLDRRQELLETEETRGSKSSNTFTNPRIRAIAQVIVNAQGIDSDAVKRRAQGRTPAESRADKLKVVGEFILDLIPLRSAIVNWRSGNYKDAAVDLAFDVFGFLTAGVGTVAKLAKGARKAGSTVSKVARASRIIGADTLSAFNPLGGLGDVAVGAGKLALTGVGAAREGIQRLRSMATGSELATASTRFDGAATGTFKAGDKVVMGDAVKYDDKWYALDANSLQPYGPPLEDFNYIDTLTPPVRSSNTHATHRVHPYQNRPDQPYVGATKQQLPAGDYAESTKGKLVPGHFIPGNGMDETKALFTQQMEDVMAAAKAPGGLPTPPTLPAEIKPTTPQNLIADAFKVSQGLVFGENHKQMASFKLLWDNIQTFKAEGVKKVYFEGVIDLPPFGIVDDGIGNLGALKNGRTKPTFKELKVEFEKNGIEVLPLDHYYLTRHKDTRIRGQSIIPGVNSEIRLKEFNYFASETIQANSGTEKWIALVGQAHMNTSEGVPGLAELTGTLGIGIYEHPMVSANVGLKAKRHIPDPTQVLKHRDRPGNLHIYMKP